MIEDPRIDPPEVKDFSFVWDLDLEDVINRLIIEGVPIEDELRERLIDILENQSL